MDIQKKFACAELKSLYVQRGNIDADGPAVSDFVEVANIVNRIAQEHQTSAFDMILGMRFFNETPVKTLTKLLFDDENEARDYCRRMNDHHGVKCSPVPHGHKRFRISVDQMN